MRKDRFQRIEDFKEFFNKSKSIFENISSNDIAAQDFDKYYSLHILPGGRAGGNNERQVDIFFGNSIYGSTKTSTGQKALVEHGATLLYTMNDDGYVSVMLYPAKAENYGLKEDVIFLTQRINPKHLLSKSVLNKHWKFFMSYMQYSSLDGSPSMWEKSQVLYLHNFKSQVVKGIWSPAKIGPYAFKLLNFALSVGLSGFIIVIVNYYIDKHKSNTSEKALIEINQNLQKILTTLEEEKKQELNTIQSPPKETKTSSKDYHIGDNFP